MAHLGMSACSVSERCRWPVCSDPSSHHMASALCSCSQTHIFLMHPRQAEHALAESSEHCSQQRWHVTEYMPALVHSGLHLFVQDQVTWTCMQGILSWPAWCGGGSWFGSWLARLLISETLRTSRSISGNEVSFHLNLDASSTGNRCIL